MTAALTTDYLLNDEKAYLLLETWREIPMKGQHRIQKVFVARGDRLAVYETDLGPVSRFPGANVFQVLSGIDDDPPMHWAYTVGEIKEIAETLRYDSVDPNPRPVKTAEEFKTVWFDNLEEKAAMIRHRTTSGPHITIQRS